jgi:GNAT superfamily N-acetyltransferase
MPGAAQGLDFEVVPAASVDAEAVAALVNAAFRRYPVMGGDRTTPAGLLEEAGPDGEFILARRDGRLVGSALVRPAAGHALEEEALGGLVDLRTSLYFGLAAVDPMEMNTGIGRALIAFAEDLARDRGYARIVLGTVREFGLVEYYTRLGYVPMAMQAYPAGHWEITVDHHHYHLVNEIAAGAAGEQQG